MKNNYKNILIVEDESIIAMDIKFRLIRMGYHVSGIASSGEEAILKTEETNPDLILMDIRLRGEMNGVEAAQYIKSNYSTPIIFLTSNSDESTLNKAKQTSTLGFIIKPFNEHELKIKLQQAFY